MVMQRQSSYLLLATFWFSAACLPAAPLQAQKPALPLIRVIAMGGTIAHVLPGEGPGARIGGEEFVKSIPQLKEHARIETEDFSRVGSGDITTKMLVDLANRINRIFSAEKEVAGIVVTMGSNTSEEVAYFLNLTVKSDKPVVVTAAQRLKTSLGAEGDRNLLDSVRVACSPQARGKGVLLVTNEEIHYARDVRKTISHRVEAWDSGDLGDLGLVDRDRVSFYRIPTRKHTVQTEFDASSLSDLPPVFILYSYIGADDVLVRHAVAEGKARGIVLAAFPTGGGAPQQVEALKKAAEGGVIVVDSHRGGLGRPAGRYPEFVDADNLTPQQARILLMLALTRTANRTEIQRMFDEY